MTMQGRTDRRTRIATSRLAGAATLLACAGATAALDVVTGPVELLHETPAFEAYREFGNREGLAQSTIYALAQDTRGTIWAGSERGVARYDGHRWRPLELPGQANSAAPYVYALAATEDGAVWISTDERGVFRHDGAYTVSIPMEEVPDAARVQGFARAGRDSVWAATGGGVFLCTPLGCSLVGDTRGLDVWTLATDTDARGQPVLWLGTLSQGLRRLERASGVEAELTSFRIGAEDGLPANTVRALAVWGGAEGRDLWIGTGFGFARYDGEHLTVYGEPLGVTSANVSAFVASRNARNEPVLYAGLTRGGYLEIGADGQWRRHTSAHGLQDEQVYSLLVSDNEMRVPRLWLGTLSTGVLRREPGRWHIIDARHGLPHRSVRALGRARFPDGIETSWISTAQGTVRLERGGWRPFGPEPLSRSVLYAVAETEPGTVWFGTDFGLIRWDRNGSEVIDHHNFGMPANTIVALHTRRAANGRTELWLGSRHGFARLVDGVFEPVHPMPEKLGPTVRNFVTTRDGDGREVVWAGGEGGLEGFHGDRWERIRPECLPHNEVMDLRTRGDLLWVATRAGVAWIRLDATRECGRLEAPGLPEGSVYQLAFDRSGRLYLFGHAGVVRLTPKHDAPRDWVHARVERFGLADGLPALEFNRAAYVDDAGRVWGGTIAGAVVLDPGRESTAQNPKPLLLDAAYRVEGGAPLGAGARLAANEASVAFAYALLSYEREHLTRFRTELVGLDAGPGEWRPDASILYTRLPPGDYAFRVWGRDAFGTIAGPRELSFSVDWPRWQQPWALVGYAGALLLFGLAAGRWRNRAIAARAHALEREIAERTRALEGANRRFEDAALTDPLTGLRNRRYFGAVLAAELDALAQRAARGDTVPSRLVCLVDLDYFKSINDRYGHAVGDRVLQRIANALRQAAGSHGAALRWGGEEFLLDLPLAQGESPAQRAEAVLENLRGCVHHVAGRELTVTGSLGWAPWPWHPAMPRLVNLDQLLTLADQALYRAKEAGRNRAVGALCDDAAAPLPEHPELRVRWV